MEYSRSLPSLVAPGGSSGTGRPTGPSDRVGRKGRSPGEERFRGELEGARRATRERDTRAASSEGERRTSRSSELPEREPPVGHDVPASARAPEDAPVPVDDGVQAVPTEAGAAREPAAPISPAQDTAASTRASNSSDAVPEPPVEASTSALAPSVGWSLAGGAAPALGASASTGPAAGAPLPPSTSPQPQGPSPSGAGTLAQSAAPELQDAAALAQVDPESGFEPEVEPEPAQRARPGPATHDASRGAAVRPDAAREPEPAARAEAPRPAPNGPPPQDERAADLLRQIRLRLSPELRQASIHLEPASLGRLDIRLEVRRSQVHAQVVAESSATLAALERHAPELRAALAAAGFEGAELSLSLASDQRPREQSATLARRAPRRRAAAVEPLAPPALEAALTQRLARAGGVDTYA